MNTHITLVACRNDESAVGAGVHGGFDNITEGCILVFSLRLRVGNVEERKCTVTVCSFDNTRFAPPAFFSIAYSEAILCAGCEVAKLNCVLCIFRGVKKQGKGKTEVCTGVASFNRFAFRLDA